MKKTVAYILAILSAVTLASCSVRSDSSTDSSTSGGTASQSESGSDPGYDAGSGIALIEIQTKSSADNVMDFVTVPITRHVSENIITWKPGFVIPEEPYYEECSVTVKDAESNELITSADANVKVRGNWTTYYDKKPLKIKFSEKQSMLGLNDGAEQKSWLLLAGYKDGSLLRDKTGLELSEKILGADGLYTSDCQLAEVVINGQYWGVYLLAEQQQTGKNRVDITEPEKDYTGTDIGYLLEFDGYFYTEDELNQFHIDYNDNAPLTPFDGGDGNGKSVKCLGPDKSDIGFTITSTINSVEQRDFIKGFVDGTYRIMYEAAYNDKAFVFNDDYSDIAPADDLTPEQAVKNVVDLDSLADMYIISEMTCDADIYWSSFYMDADFGENGDRRLTFEAPWDFDSSMGNKPCCPDGTGFYAASLVSDVNDTYKTVNPWLTVLIYEDWFQDIIREKWTAAWDSGVFSDIIAQVAEDADTYSDAFDRNYQRWNNLADKSAFENELAPKSAACTTQQQATDYLAEWLTTRADFLNDYWHS